MNATAAQDLINRSETITDLLCGEACLVADAWMAKRRETGEDANAEAVLAAAIDAVLESWARDMPHLFDRYLAEHGITA